jgi:hypothetical protein
VGSVFALVSPGGSPGVTTAALALAVGWPGRVIVAECDPAGGDVLAGTLAGHASVKFGLMEHAIEAGRDPLAAAQSLAAQLVPLDQDGTRLLLPGLTDPRQATGLAAAWPAIASTLTAQSCDVIADCGRLGPGVGQPHAVLAAASAVALVLRPTLRQVWAARPRIEMLAQLLGGVGRVALIVTGAGSHPPREVAGLLGVPLAAVLPPDAPSAAVLSDGARRHRHFKSGPLLAAARPAAQALRGRAAAMVSPPFATPATLAAAPAGTSESWQR